MAVGICQLCLGDDKILVKQSHIIPAFMYNGLFDENHTMLCARLKNHDRPPQKSQTGYWDKNILCKECENLHLGELDRYASSVIFGGVGVKNVGMHPVQEPGKLRVLKVSNLDFKFKIFILSVLWRAHISKHSFFKNIDLGDEAEKLRKVIRPGSELSTQNYSVNIFGIIGKEGGPVKFILEPFYRPSPTGNLAVFYINGFLYLINIGVNQFYQRYEKYALASTGSLTIPLLEGAYAKKLLYALKLPGYVVNNFV
jgi:hypothetical protein